MSKEKKAPPSEEARLYTTVAREAAVEFREKKSLFIGYAAPVKTEAEASDFIRKIRTMHREATHNVYAYSLANGNIMRYSDDGEPQGTAGIPVLDVIRKSGVNDTVVVVTRYFGGILLGAGGLLRAYSAAARMAIEEAEIVTYEGYTEFTLSCSYSDYQKVQYELPQYGIITDDISFGETVELKLAIKDRIYFAFEKRVSELSNGKIRPVIRGSRFDFR